MQSAIPRLAHHGLSVAAQQSVSDKNFADCSQKTHRVRCSLYLKQFYIRSGLDYTGENGTGETE